MMYPCFESLLEHRVAIRINDSYEEQAQVYGMSYEMKTR